MRTVMVSRRDLLASGIAGWVGGSALLPSAQASSGVGPLPIRDVETYALQHRLPRAIGPSTILYGYRDALLVKITAEGGLVGWGETADVGGTRGIIEGPLKSKLIGQDAMQIRQRWRELWGPNFGDGRAVGAVDIALHDLRGKALNQSVADMMGGRLRNRVLAYAAAMNYTEGVAPEEQHPSEAAELVRRGFRAMKLRTGRFGVRRDLAVLAKVREAVGPDVRLLTDGNGAFTLPAAIQFGKELEKLDFYCWEEPLPQGLNYAGYDTLAQSLDIAVAGGEVLDSRAAARDHLVRRSFDIIQPDVTLCGGIAEVLFIGEMARLWSIQCMPHCWGGAIAIAATLQVLSLLPAYTWGFSSDEPMLEFDTYENPFRDEIVTRPIEVRDGYVEVPTGPGLGIEINEDIVRKYRKRS
ncbi:MAG: mandelate racemase/muconate lactonizing enzyme family protein [Pirellulaceae bacterium]